MGAQLTRLRNMTRTDRSNEGKACDVILGNIEAREGEKRRDLIFPEKTHHVGPVELVCTIGEQRFAFEHTRIEPFAGHIQLEAEAERHFQPITDMLAGKLPVEDRFELNVPAGVLLGRNDREVRPIQEALVKWVVATAPSLPIARLGRYVLPAQKVTPPEVPFAVSLHRWKREGFPFPFSIVHLVDSNIEDARFTRIQEAYSKKLTKLLKWKECGARAILILEEDDIQLTNHFRVGDALFQIETLHTNRPDEVYLISTSSSVWFVIRLRIGDESFYEMPIDDRYWEVSPASLVNLTGDRRKPKLAIPAA
jgi:hypothetical protein